MAIRLNGFTTPLFGVSWEYTDEKKKNEINAIESLFVILESKRLIMLPFSRNIMVKFETDINRCSYSTLDLKATILGILKEISFPPETISVLKNMINCCNELLEKLSKFEGLDGNFISYQRTLFLNDIDSFKKKLFPQIEILSEQYKIDFSLPESD